MIKIIKEIKVKEIWKEWLTGTMMRRECLNCKENKTMSKQEKNKEKLNIKDKQN